jgi:hypothetical protein
MTIITDLISNEDRRSLNAQRVVWGWVWAAEGRISLNNEWNPILPAGDRTADGPHHSRNQQPFHIAKTRDKPLLLPRPFGFWSWGFKNSVSAPPTLRVGSWPMHLSLPFHHSSHSNQTTFYSSYQPSCRMKPLEQKTTSDNPIRAVSVDGRKTRYQCPVHHIDCKFKWVLMKSESEATQCSSSSSRTKYHESRPINYR